MKIQDVQGYLKEFNKLEKCPDFFKNLGYQVLSLTPAPEEDSLTDRAKKLVQKIFLISDYCASKSLPFRVYFVELNQDRFRRTDLRCIIEPLYRKYAMNAIFVFAKNESPYQELAFVSPKWISEPRDKNKIRLFLRTLVTEPSNPYRTDLEVLQGIDAHGIKDAEQIWQKHQEAFDVTRVTERFFDDFKKVFSELEQMLYTHKDKSPDSKKWAHDFSLQLLSRIMFIYFIQRKRWLYGPNGPEQRFMRVFWNAYKEWKDRTKAKDSFYKDWLSVLFFEAFNRKYQNRHEYVERFPQWLQDAMSVKAPWLNGGLFSRNSLDDRLTFAIPDEFFEKLFDRWEGDTPGFFERYNFTIVETSRFDEEVAVDPEMIGNVYESLVNISFERSREEEEERDLRGKAGIFYTPRVEIDLMCRLAVVDWLSNVIGKEYKNLLYEWVFSFAEEERREAEQQITNENLWNKLDKALTEIQVCDPACGSGSFLVGMLLVLDELQSRTQEVLQTRKESAYDRRKRIIQDSLYGVDVMEWAVRVAELRLWLQLVVETELEPWELMKEPLLPNLSFKILPADSIIQEVGDHLFIPHKIPKELSSLLKGRLTTLKGKKSAYFKSGDNTADLEKEIKREEFRLFQDILEDRKLKLENEIKKVKGKLSQTWRTLDGQVKSALDEKTRKQLEEEQKSLQSNLELIEEELSALKSSKTPPFLWDLAFVEVFNTKGGFDIVIGNPPYVRQENIAPPHLDPADYGGENSDEWKNIKKSYKAKLEEALRLSYPKFFANRTIDKKSDYYVYFYFYCLRLLNPKGTFCFITSNSWLDVGYGKDLQEFLLRHCHVKMIIDNQVKRSFKQADINTIIALLSPPDESSNWGLDRTARFVMFKKPFEQVLSPIIFEEIEEAIERTTRPEYRVYPISQMELLESGWEFPEGVIEEGIKGVNRFDIGKYVGNKWGGKYLRAPEIYFKILEKGKDKLVRLGDIAEVRFGIKTGANELFYLKPIGMTVKEVVDIAEKNPNTLIRVKNSAGWEGEIEAEFLKPVIKSPRELKTIIVRLADLNHLVFMCHKSERELKGTRAWEYIKWGERQSYHKRPTCKGRPRWWDLGEKIFADFLWIMIVRDRFAIFYNKYKVYDDHTMGDIIVKNKGLVFNYCLFFNSTIFRLFLESNIRNYGGGGGPIAPQVYEFNELIIPNFINKLDIKKLNFNDFINREIRSIFTELGFDPKKPIREQEPNPLPDRKALDDIVFDALGLTEDERKEVYWAVAELVKNRLEKAKSV